MGWQDVTPSDAVEAADWIPGRLNGFAKNVGSIVPKGFDAYARIFHPGTERPSERDAPTVEVRWAEVAARSGKIVGSDARTGVVAEHQLNVQQPRQLEIGREPGRSVDLPTTFLPAHPPSRCRTHAGIIPRWGKWTFTAHQATMSME